MASVSVDLGAKHGHNFDQIGAELFHYRLIRSVLEDCDFDPEEPADLEDDFTAKAQQAVFVGEDEFFNLALQDEQEQAFEPGFLVIESTAEVGDYQVHRLTRLLLHELPLTFQVSFLVVGRDSHIADRQRLGAGWRHLIMPMMAESPFGFGEFAFAFPTSEGLRVNPKFPGHL